MTINLKAPELRELKPRIIVCGVGGGGCNAVNNMIASGLSGVDFLVANTDAQALMSSRAERVLQMGLQVTEGLGAGAQPEIGRAAAEEAREEIREQLHGAHMCFVTAGMGGGTGTGAAPVIAQIAREMGILTVGVVTKPFHFEGQRRMRIADAGIGELQTSVDTLIVIPNQNLFRIATERTTFADAFAMADQVLYSGVASVTDLMVKEGLINLDFADVRSIMRGMGKAMMGTGEASGERRASLAAEAAIANPLLDEVSMRGARGLLISITGGDDLTLYEVDEAASRIRQEVDEDANIILGATFDSALDGIVRVSVVATGIDPSTITVDDPTSLARMTETAERLRAQLIQQTRQQPAAHVAVAEAPIYVTQAPVAQAPVAHAPVAHAPAPAQAYQPEPAEQAYYAEQPSAPVAPAPIPQSAASGVYYEPAAARPTYAEPMVEAHAPRMAAEPAPYVPPLPEAPRPRMPSVEDFPRPVQEQIRQARGEAVPVEARRKSIFERLASFGASRQEDAMQAAPAPARPLPPQSAHAEYARRPAAPAGLDPHGRRAPQQRVAEDDHLEIPAFLRRQSNS
jgi:cell division protein FtsZ